MIGGHQAQGRARADGERLRVRCRLRSDQAPGRRQPHQRSSSRRPRRRPSGTGEARDAPRAAGPY
eukprot:1859737-Prymnesium_polylepis.1